MLKKTKEIFHGENFSLDQCLLHHNQKSIRKRLFIGCFDLIEICFSSTIKFDRGTWRGKFSKFLSKIFWHFNRVVPNYPSMKSPRSHEKSLMKFHQPRVIYPIRARRSLIRQRQSTLMSIREENEFELLNCI